MSVIFLFLSGNMKFGEYNVVEKTAEFNSIKIMFVGFSFFIFLNFFQMFSW